MEAWSDPPGLGQYEDGPNAIASAQRNAHENQEEVNIRKEVVIDELAELLQAAEDDDPE